MTEPSVAAISDYPKARWWAAVGIIVAVVGAAVSTAWFVWGLNRVDDGLDALVVVGGEGPARVTVVESVDWTIYLEPSDRSLSGIRFEFVDAESGDLVALEPPRNDVDYSVGDRTGRPISRARLEAGDYLVDVSPTDVVLAIGPDVGDLVQWMWLGAVLIALPTVVGGGTVAAVNVLRALRPARSGSASRPSSADTAVDPGRPARSEPPTAPGERASEPPPEPPAPPEPPPAAPAPPDPPDAAAPSATPPADRPPLPPPDPSKRRDR